MKISSLHFQLAARREIIVTLSFSFFLKNILQNVLIDFFAQSPQVTGNEEGVLLSKLSFYAVTFPIGLFIPLSET